MRTFYYPESINDWEYNLLQGGGSLPRFSGVAYQRGQGIGSFFRGIFRAVWPALKRVGIEAGRQAIQAGSEATRDYLNEGVDFKSALKRRGKQALGRTITKVGERLQEGRGVGKRAVKKSIKGLVRRKRKASRKPDIFGNG